MPTLNFGRAPWYQPWVNEISQLASHTPGDEAARRSGLAASVRARLDGRSLVLVGMMGAGKTSIGRRLAATLGMPFVDADVEIEKAAGMSVSEIFVQHGEAHFRDGERRVISRILGEQPVVLATGGGAWMNAQTRERISQRGISIWLKADIDVLLQRVRKRSNRPLLHADDPEKVLRGLVEERYPVYALADHTVVSREGPHFVMIDMLLDTLDSKLKPVVGKPQVEPPTNALQIPAAIVAPKAGCENVCVAVELGARRYEIHIGAGLLQHAGDAIARLAPHSRCAIVTDANVATHCLAALEASLKAAGISSRNIVIEPGEASKSWPVFTRVCDAVLEARLERGDIIIALGGGVVGDLTGFAAASIRRGMRCVQIPTTLLAQVDSSVGGKTAINSEHGKNLIGAFHQPSLVLIDTDVLATLPDREFRAGYAEVAKYGLIDDAAFFAWLEANWREIFARGPALTHAIAVSCRSKAAIVARDETETGDRALLNLGHTFGHALETITRFNSRRLVHGEGVAIGLACAFRLSARLKHCSREDAQRVEAHLRAVGLPTCFRDIAGWNAGADSILDAMYQDKKVERGALTFILARGIGQSFIARHVAASDVKSFLRDELGY